MSPALIEKLKARGRQRDTEAFAHEGIQTTPKFVPEEESRDRVFLDPFPETKDDTKAPKTRDSVFLGQIKSQQMSESQGERDKIDLGFNTSTITTTERKKPSLFSQAKRADKGDIIPLQEPEKAVRAKPTTRTKG